MTEQSSERIREIHEMLLKGHTNPNIRDFIKTQWSSDEQDLVLEALSIFAETARQARDIHVGWCIDALKDTYRMCNEVGDFPAAVKCIQEIAKLTEKICEPKETREKDGQEIDESTDPRAALRIRLAANGPGGSERFGKETA